MIGEIIVVLLGVFLFIFVAARILDTGGNYDAEQRVRKGDRWTH